MRHSISLPGGTRLNAQVDGPAGAPWVVLSNSVLTDLSIWDGQIAALADRFRVLRYDQRGHGGSDLPEGPMGFESYGADLAELLDALDIRRCIFVGLSMGVPTGLAALAKDPDRFAAFVAVDGVARSAPGREAFWSERRETARTKGMTLIAEQTTTRWLPGTAPSSALSHRLCGMIAATPTEGFAAATHALQSYDQSAALPLLTGPFLGLAGALDGAMPQAVRAQFGGLPQARFDTVTDAGHVPNFQNPAAFNAALMGFLEAHEDLTTKETT